MEKDYRLLKKELCARLPYGIKVALLGSGELEVTSVIISSIGCYVMMKDVPTDFSIDEVKPYLRSMSNMTDEEEQEYEDWHLELEAGRTKDWKFADYIEWLNSHHLDYLRLIEKGLALEAPEGMYS